MHLLGLLAVITMLMDFSWWTLPAMWLGWFVTGCLGAEIGLHRLFSHKAFALTSTPLRWLIGWASCMSGQWSPIFWAALHRGYHHPSADTERDIHSPLHGAWTAFMGWMFTLKEGDVNLRYARDLVRDPMQQFLHKHYLAIFWSTMAIGTLFGWQVFCAAFVLPVLLAMHQENLVNWVCHVESPLGYRHFEVADRSVNIYPLGLLFWGQGFHNNHHAKPNRYNFGIKWYEFDLCRWVVPALMILDKLWTPPNLNKLHA